MLSRMVRTPLDISSDIHAKFSVLYDQYMFHMEQSDVTFVEASRSILLDAMDHMQDYIIDIGNMMEEWGPSIATGLTVVSASSVVEL